MGRRRHAREPQNVGDVRDLADSAGPKDRRGRLLAAVVALAAIGVVASRSFGDKDPAPDQPTRG